MLFKDCIFYLLSIKVCDMINIYVGLYTQILANIFYSIHSASFITSGFFIKKDLIKVLLVFNLYPPTIGQVG